MFALEQINDVHDRLGNAETLSQYLEALKNIGIVKYDSFITDGHSEYFGKGGNKVVSPPVHEKLTIAETSNRESFLKHLNLHNQGKTNYFEMSKGLADSGIEKWTFDTNKMTNVYYDKDGNEILVETIKWECNFDFLILASISDLLHYGSAAEVKKSLLLSHHFNGNPPVK